VSSDSMALYKYCIIIIIIIIIIIVLSKSKNMLSEAVNFDYVHV